MENEMKCYIEKLHTKYVLKKLLLKNNRFFSVKIKKRENIRKERKKIVALMIV